MRRLASNLIAHSHPRKNYFRPNRKLPKMSKGFIPLISHRKHAPLLTQVPILALICVSERKRIFLNNFFVKYLSNIYYYYEFMTKFQVSIDALQYINEKISIFSVSKFNIYEYRNFFIILIILCKLLPIFNPNIQS